MKLYKNFVFVDDAMYYYMRNPNGLHCIRNGSDRLISDNADIHEFSMTPYGGELYFTVFTDEYSRPLFKYNSQDNSIQRVASIDGFSREMRLKNGCVYYLDSVNTVREVKIP